ncbi:MAG: hypothetical protein E6Q66_01885 [Pedobacter sp.]|jgi:hypothetical protein|nr:MAG: hypothetical protein E6Q66_01885 [Pedobacter sp.]
MEKYTNNKEYIGIWLDHSEAHFIRPYIDQGIINTIHSSLESRQRIPGEAADGTRVGKYHSTNNEYTKHQLQQNQIHAFYKQIAEALLSYTDIFIFGPTTAREELENYLLGEMKKKFENKKIRLEASDYMTKNQMVERVIDFFKAHG